jgi:tRNA(Ser,Leu) C12 N-acetylase TAN1
MTKMRREKTQISKIRNAKGEVTKNTMGIQGIIRDYFENLYSNKLEYLKEMDKFLDTYDHPKLNHEDINHLHRAITYNEIEAAINSLPKRKVQDMKDSLLNCTRPLKKGKEHCLTHSMKSVLHSS